MTLEKRNGNRTFFIYLFHIIPSCKSLSYISFSLRFFNAFKQLAAPTFLGAKREQAAWKHPSGRRSHTYICEDRHQTVVLNLTMEN